jgi:hypothetical protein
LIAYQETARPTEPVPDFVAWIDTAQAVGQRVTPLLSDDRFVFARRHEYPLPHGFVGHGRSRAAGQAVASSADIDRRALAAAAA